jgi:hypothetical protein
MCELSIRLPHRLGKEGSTYKEDKGKIHLGKRVHAGQDASCAAIKEQTAHMNELQTNLHFCRDPPEAQKLFKDEVKFVRVKKGGANIGKNTYMVLAKLDTHKVRCEKFLKAHKKSELGGSLTGLWEDVANDSEEEMEYIEISEAGLETFDELYYHADSADFEELDSTEHGALFKRHMTLPEGEFKWLPMRAAPSNSSTNSSD